MTTDWQAFAKDYLAGDLEKHIPEWAREGHHGPAHWARVERNARMLAASVEGADLDVCVWFARLHDTMRDSEFDDPGHGPRAAEMAVALWRETAGELGALSREQIDLLHEAIDRHDLGEVSDDPTIGCCWDADRLELLRVGVEPDPDLMSTRMGKTLAAKMRTLLRY